MTTLLEQVMKEVPADVKQMVFKCFDITEYILDILDKKNMTQKDLALKLGKRESEISRWMRGFHNFTLETIAKIEIALGEKIIDTPKNFLRKKEESKKTAKKTNKTAAPAARKKSTTAQATQRVSKKTAVAKNSVVKKSTAKKKKHV